MKNTILLCAAWAGFLFNAHAADFPKAKSNNWHHWRGPEANGIAPTAKPPTKWSEEKNVRWKAPIDGFGTSTPIIWGKQVFVSQASDQGSTRSLLCFSLADGRKLWEQSVRHEYPHLP